MQKLMQFSQTFSARTKGSRAVEKPCLPMYRHKQKTVQAIKLKESSTPNDECLRICLMTEDERKTSKFNPSCTDPLWPNAGDSRWELSDHWCGHQCQNYLWFLLEWTEPWVTHADRHRSCTLRWVTTFAQMHLSWQLKECKVIKPTHSHQERQTRKSLAPLGKSHQNQTHHCSGHQGLSAPWAGGNLHWELWNAWNSNSEAFSPFLPAGRALQWGTAAEVSNTPMQACICMAGRDISQTRAWRKHVDHLL